MTTAFRNNVAIDIEDPTITYEVGIDEVLHPDLNVALRLIEIRISECPYGCKIYADPRSNVRILAHNRSYGCNRTIPISERNLS